MSSILKILVDIQCLVYCDFEQVGEASPNSIFKMELRKGMYIIEFRKDDISLKSIKYKIESDDEDYLLEESLANIYKKVHIRFSNVELLAEVTGLEPINTASKADVLPITLYL